jgi:hypothetical protein
LTFGHYTVSVTPSTSVRKYRKEVSMTLAGEEQAEQILSQDSQGRVLVTRERRESL